MTRIISGFAGSLRLAVPNGATRPTSDRTREGIFSALDARGVLDGARVLDLYAGSGALGLEAVSRGAVSAQLVDSSASAASACKRNAATVSASPRAPRGLQLLVTRQTTDAFLSTDTATYDLVFLDPPYDVATEEIDRTLQLVAERIAPDGLIVLERSTRSADPRWPDGIELNRARDYGETRVFYAQPA
ncbi:16S rRNA (guanine(966)-N(2))-methyltransferase RsmD [Naasia lichenicola]|uniref:16S rRNA (Guanine(966)-N(2))-methyltransferase RsmD n=1 Tax=Naasia lichenicola TaxID=2565933 RepID=A0A4S4FNH5_9MICO|nr:16S rRNA (guanine(966)-N(2))-methyltransferase RsmD [Naasia lichenicola]THG31778.1 16S rRNA (guanine(966)-N(2))-methyltransferase RsmD [Naasia lichenicola]